jgi:uncharacterized protein
VRHAGRPPRAAATWARCARVASLALALAVALLGTSAASAAQSGAQSNLPELTQPVNDFAHVIDASSAATIDGMSRRLMAATGDVVVVATVPTVQPYADVREYANRLFENHGRGIGQKGRDNGLLIVVAVAERQVWIEVGYDLEQWITDGFAGETTRQYMLPEFRSGRYGAGLVAGTARIVGRIAQGRNVTLEGVRVPQETARPDATPVPLSLVAIAFIVILILSRVGGGPGASIRRWGGGPWSGWSSGVGPFGGGFGGGGGGFGGGFGGFGGGGSGGGGGGGSW